MRWRQSFSCQELKYCSHSLTLRKQFLKLDIPEGMIRQFASPPSNPTECVFALTTQTLSADLKTKSVPCQFGENRTAVRADALLPWAWRLWRRTNWAVSFPSERSSKL